MEPATIWTDGNGEWSSPGVAELADASGNLLVDASSNDLADSGKVFTPYAATVWTVNDGDA